MPYIVKKLTFATVCQGCGGPLPASKGPGPKRKWCSERCRRSQHRGVCVDCGGPTDGSNGPGKESERCLACHIASSRTLEARRAHSVAVTGCGKYSDAVILARLREAAVDGVCSVTIYERARQAGWPSVSLVITRFGYWRVAVEAAGLRTKGARRVYARRWTVPRMLAVLLACEMDLGHLPTVSEFDQWSRSHDAPSACLVRDRFGGWIRALDAAREWEPAFGNAP